MEEVSYKLAPKGILYAAMMDTGILDGITEGQFNACWILFEHGMKESGYVQEDI